MNLIDLRSDTVTKPSPEMRANIANAVVGDDVYAEDETINLLQDKVANLFGKEAALYVPSGTMSNQICLKILTEAGDEIICENDAHIYFYETAGPSIISNVQLRPIPSENGAPKLEDIENAIRPDIYYFPVSKVIALENTHNRHGGTVLPIDYIKEVKDLAQRYNLYTHLDGARIWNASVATGVALSEYAKYFDTISVCLSKGMGAPVGSLVVSSKENIKKALKWRKILGGGMRQAGILAAAGIYAIDNNLKLIELDHSNAKYFANEINKINYINCNIDNVQTNIVAFELDNIIRASNFVDLAKSKGLLLSAIGNNKIRVVFHLDINKEQTAEAVNIIKSIINEIR